MTEYRSKRDAKRLAREVKPGQKLYTICELKTNLPIDKRLYSEWTVRDGGFWAGPIVGMTTTVEQLVLREGPVYTEPPRGMRNIADPLPQLAEPIAGGRDGWRHFSRAEIASLEKEVQRASEETRR
ncbi:hypothetical protein [Streptomyces sp. DW26H14]|uniref:hypothetical protein n=1 Tax=Streptomyces sp. DW26H14 TaxID=3435395 RepID=UPI00403D65EA